MRRIIVRTLFLIFLGLVLASPQPGRAADPPYRVMLPLVLRPPATISGHVTVWDQPLAGIDLGTNCADNIVTSDATGYFFFHVRPDVPADAKCVINKIVYNPGPYYGDLGFWVSGPVHPYPDPLSPKPVDFNLADILPLSPAYGSEVTLPVTFRWQKVTGFPDANYQLYITGGAQGNFYSPLLGDVDNYTLSTLPAEISPNISYIWYLEVLGSDDSYGIGRRLFTITFLGGGSTANRFLSPDLQPDGLNLISYLPRWLRP